MGRVDVTALADTLPTVSHVHTKYCSRLAAATAISSAVGAMKAPQGALDSCAETVSPNLASHREIPFSNLPALSTLIVGFLDPGGGIGLMTYLGESGGGGGKHVFTYVSGLCWGRVLWSGKDASP